MYKLNLTARFAAGFLLSFLSFPLTPAPVSPHPRQGTQSDKPIKLNTELVVVDVGVKTKNLARNIINLKSGDFSVYEDGVKQHLTHFSQDILPLSIILLLDTSGSVQPVIEQIRDGALQALRRLKPEDEVALIAFASKTKLIHDFTTDRKAIADAIEGIKERANNVGRGTFLDEGIYQAANHLHGALNPDSRRIIIAVTDNVSPKGLLHGHTTREALDEAFESGAVVCGLIVRSWISKTSNVIGTVLFWNKLLLSTRVENYSNNTGGEVMAAGREEIETKLRDLIDTLRTRYSLGYVPSSQKRDGKFRRIKVVVSSEVEKHEGKLTIFAKRGYYARDNHAANSVEKPTHPGNKWPE